MPLFVWFCFFQHYLSSFYFRFRLFLSCFTFSNFSNFFLILLLKKQENKKFCTALFFITFTIFRYIRNSTENTNCGFLFSFVTKILVFFFVFIVTKLLALWVSHLCSLFFDRLSAPVSLFFCLYTCHILYPARERDLTLHLFLPVRNPNLTARSRPTNLFKIAGPTSNPTNVLFMTPTRNPPKPPTTSTNSPF